MVDHVSSYKFSTRCLTNLQFVVVSYKVYYIEPGLLNNFTSYKRPADIVLKKMKKKTWNLFTIEGPIQTYTLYNYFYQNPAAYELTNTR